MNGTDTHGPRCLPPGSLNPAEVNAAGWPHPAVWSPDGGSLYTVTHCTDLVSGKLIRVNDGVMLDNFTKAR